MRKSFFISSLLLFSLLLNAQTDTSSVSRLLQFSLEELMNIKVTSASGFAQTTAEAPSTIVVITAEQIRERGYEQLEDALRDVPGIDMIHINGYAPTLFYFRGMYGAENLRALLMIDGVVENNILGSNDMAGPTYSLHKVERIEIIWGPASAIYGANAFGGVIHIITKKGGTINGFQFEQGLGSFNTSFQKLLFGVRKQKWEFALAGTLYSSDGPQFSNRDPNYSASYIDKAHSVNAVVSYHGQRSVTTGGYRLHRTPMGWGTYSNSPTVYFRLPAQGNSNAGVIGIAQRDLRGERSGKIDSYLRTWYLQHEMKPNDKWNILARFIYRETGQGENSYVYVTVDGRKLIRALIASYSNRIGGEVQANFNLAKDHKFYAGLQVNQDNVEAGSRRTTIDLNTVYLLDGRDTLLNLNSTFLPREYDVRNNIGGFVQYNFTTDWLRSTSFTAGMRFDHNSYFGDVLSPRAAIVNKPHEKLTLKLQYGRAFRAPTNLEIYQVPGRNFPLKQEKLNTYEFNVVYDPSKKIHVQLNAYRNDMKDVIVLGNLNNLTPNKNPAKFRIHGLELNSEMQFTKSTRGFFNFTYMHTWGKNLVTGAEGRIPVMTRFKGNAGMTFHVQDIFLVSLTGNYVGKRPVQRTNPYGTVDGYLLANLFISAPKFFKDKVTVSLRVNNIFDKDWLDPGFRTADGSLYATVLEQPGINAILKIGFNL